MSLPRSLAYGAILTVAAWCGVAIDTARADEPADVVALAYPLTVDRALIAGDTGGWQPMTEAPEVEAAAAPSDGGIALKLSYTLSAR